MKSPQRTQAPIVVAVEDPLLLPEALHVAAACGRPVLEVSDRSQLSRVRGRAWAMLVDASFAPPDPTPTTFVVAASTDAAAPGAFVLPAQAADLLRALGALAQRGIVSGRDAGTVIAVIGAGGGVGASTLAGAVCKRASSRGATLVDAHSRSGGLDLLMGIEDVPGARWGEIELGEGVVAREDVRRALPTTRDGVAVLTCGRSSIVEPPAPGRDAVEAVVSAVGADGVTVLDAPVELVPARCDLAVIVVAPQLRPAAAAAGIAAALQTGGVPHALAVRDSAWASLSSEELATVAGAPVLTTVRNCRGLTGTVERRGLPERLPRPLAQAANAVLAEAGAPGFAGAAR
ncbi:hypothetical protein JZY91_00420 [Corynebacterium sp. CNCTC7651]|nr:septum site-determining protein Ssd [Corynebacterium sp. CNCTC7651]UIZ92322.1 hypothetical protein JZY91_00420 [Corynebacterium sp. CNCTC7651]